MFSKMKKVHHISSIVAGLGILFIGMDMMGAAMEPLQESEAFINLMTQFSNPLIGILVGAVFTAVIQSSSASVGILQALAATGMIPLSGAVYVLFGQNIGTCITAVLASIGTKGERETDHDHPSDVQYHRYSYLYRDLHGDAVRGLYRVPYAGRPGIPDRERTYDLQYRDHAAPASVPEPTWRRRRRRSCQTARRPTTKISGCGTSGPLIPNYAVGNSAIAITQVKR